MADSRSLLVCLVALAAFAAPASCGGTNATTGPEGVVDGGVPDQVATDKP